jgi:hypothetical protein
MAGRKVPVPAWADELIDRVCATYGVERPDVIWRRLPPKAYSRGRKRNGQITLWVREHAEDSTRGRCYYPTPMARHPNGLVIVECRDDDAIRTRKTLLHELAHLVSPRGACHSPEFYVNAYRLYECYGGALTLSQAFEWEKRYKPRNARIGMRDYLDGGWAEVRAA